MKIWLLEVGESLPVGDNRGCRLRRIGILARRLAAAGHEVTWWASTFDHYQKRHVVETEVPLPVSPGLRIQPLRGCGYTRNLSLKRLLDYVLVAFRFRHHSARLEQPDIILSGFPSVELSFVALRYGLARHIPVILDVKDMWPDIFMDHAPAYLRPLLRVVLCPWFWMTRWLCAHATATTGMTEAFVEWALQRGGRVKTLRDRSFPFGYADVPPSEQALREAEAFWDARSVTAAEASRTVCFLGGIGHQLDLTTVVRAARRLRDMGRPIRFVMCGTGDRLAEYRAQTRDLDQVLWAGWVDAAKMYVLMRRSMAGLDPLPDRFDFLASINNKAIEYFSAGLPVISSPSRGVLSELLAASRTGTSYECGDDDRLASILCDLADHPDQRTAMGLRSRQLFEERFVADKVYGEMTAYIESIGCEKGRA